MQINSIGQYNISYNQAVSAAKQYSDSNRTDNVPSASIVNKNIPFQGLLSGVFNSKFKTPEEKKMYKEISGILTGKDKSNFDILYKTGRLLNTNSNDKTSTLENLYKIYKEPKIQGLDNKKILSETIERLANPFVINQKFGIIPREIVQKVLIAKKTNQSDNVAPNEPKTENDMFVPNSSSCVAASIEFSLADRKPAEFARFVAGLTSPDMAVNQQLKLSNLNSNKMDALHLLSAFNVKPLNPSWDEAIIKIAPDRDAIIRARVQNTKHDGKTRSSVDVLLQSAFMQLGSQNTYNSLTDKRYGSLNTNDTGLTEYEKTFVESIVGNDGEKTSVVYQNVNDNSILEGYFHNPEVVQEHLLKTLAQNKNVIIGITETDNNNKILGGHEITIIGYKKKGNELYFVYNDTDDGYSGAIEEKASVLIPKIHHAGIPVSVLTVNETIDQGKELLKKYSEKNKEAA